MADTLPGRLRRQRSCALFDAPGQATFAGCAQIGGTLRDSIGAARSMPDRIQGSEMEVLDRAAALEPIQVTRRQFLKAAVGGAGGLALYAGEIERHWLQASRYDVALPGLAPEFDGYRLAQLSDIHMDEFTEPFFVRDAVRRIDQVAPDAVLLTGDFVTHQIAPRRFAEGSAWQCANILAGLKCRQRYAIFGNHDVLVSEGIVGAALRDNGIAVLRNSYLPLERNGARLWLAGLDDPVEGRPDPEAAVPASIRNRTGEPVILLCHAPDYVDKLRKHPAGQAVSLVLSGHTHGGQVRIPLMPLVHLPPLGRKYVEGWFSFGSMQLHVNRGLGTVGVPFRFRCAPELTVLTLRAAPPAAAGGRVSVTRT
jgi:predicted MPP superfamily phosphohydrolase